MSLLTKPLTDSNIDPENIYDAFAAIIMSYEMFIHSVKGKEHTRDMTDIINDVLETAQKLQDARKDENETGP